MFFNGGSQGVNLFGMKNILLARKDEEGVEMFWAKIHLRNGGRKSYVHGGPGFP